MVTFKTGRRYPDPAHAARSIKFKDILKAAPAHPISEDYLGSMSGWQILGNDIYGDCVAVAWANSRRFFCDELTGVDKYPTQDDVFTLYRTQNPDFPKDDNGMDIQAMLEYVLHNGGPDGVKPVAFANVDVNNLDEVKAALYIFGGIILGIEIQKENQVDFRNGVDWDYHPGGTSDGGHGVLAGGYLSQASNDIRFITWGGETGMTDSFWSNLVVNTNGEAWVVIWPENLGTKQFVEGIDRDALAANYKALTGSDLFAPAPTPEPTPPPVPGPGPTPTPTPAPGCIPGVMKAVWKIVAGS